MERIKTASDQFDSFVPSEKVDKLKFAAGDIMVGESVQVNEAAKNFENAIGIMASAVGNHECDISSIKLAELTNDSNYKLVALNAKIDPKNPLSKKVVKSYIQEKDGTKYGVMGLMPFDLYTRIKYKDNFKGLEIQKFSDTVKDMQKEIDKLKS